MQQHQLVLSAEGFNVANDQRPCPGCEPLCEKVKRNIFMAGGKALLRDSWCSGLQRVSLSGFSLRFFLIQEPCQQGSVYMTVASFCPNWQDGSETTSPCSVGFVTYDLSAGVFLWNWSP